MRTYLSCSIQLCCVLSRKVVHITVPCDKCLPAPTGTTVFLQLSGHNIIMRCVKLYPHPVDVLPPITQNYNV